MEGRPRSFQCPDHDRLALSGGTDDGETAAVRRDVPNAPGAQLDAPFRYARPDVVEYQLFAVVIVVVKLIGPLPVEVVLREEHRKVRRLENSDLTAIVSAESARNEALVGRPWIDWLSC